jgi:hypothetical protein
VQDRILQELLEYHAKADTNKRIAIERETKRKEKNTNRGQPVNEPPPNQEPLTTNHKPITIKKTVAPPFGVTESVWQDWLKLRKEKKAAVTQTALDGIEREAKKAGVSLQTALETCCARGWTGFKAEWMEVKTTHQDKTLAAARAIFGDERNFNVAQIT